MKYLIKECNVTYCHNKWGGLMVRVFGPIPNVKGSNLMGGVVCVQNNLVSLGISETSHCS